MRRHPAWLCRKSPVPPPVTKPVPSSCQGICNTCPSLKQPLRHRTEHIPAQTFQWGRGFSQRSTAVGILCTAGNSNGECPTLVVPVEGKHHPVHGLTSAKPPGPGPTATSRQQQEAALPPPMATPPRDAQQPLRHHIPPLPATITPDLCSALGQPQHLQGCRRASALIRRLAQPWG